MLRRRFHVALAVLFFACLPLGAFMYARVPVLPFIPAGSRVDLVRIPLQEQFLAERVRYLSDTIGERNYLHPDRLEAAAVYIQTAFELAGYRPESQYYAVKDKTYRNIIARRDGEGAALVIGAHFDSAPGTKGADDNASAVAVLLEMARYAQTLPPGRAIEFVAFTNEEALEFGLRGMGSYHYVHQARKTGKALGEMICLEMLGYYSEHEKSQDYPRPLHWFFPNRGNFAALVANWSSRGHLKRLKAPLAASGFEIRTAILPRITPGVDFSDHENFWNAGIPAVLVTDTAFYRNPHYHQPTDTWETLDYPRLARLTEALCAALRSMNRLPA
jgi:Zn-dependent M28 family amino/carboxypeptidase